MNSNDHPDRPASEDDQIGDRNVERLLSGAYQPESLDPAFVERVRQRAHKRAHKRAQTNAAEQHGTTRVRPSRHWLRPPNLAIAASCAIVLLLTTAIFLATRPGSQVTQQVYSDGDYIWIDGKPFVPAALVGGHEAPSTPGAPRLTPAPEVSVPGLAIDASGLTPGPSPQPIVARQLAVGDTLATAAREWRRVSLPDGSELFLDQNTSLSVLENRRISVARGNVFIDVAPMGAADDQPTFAVSTPDRHISAWGTKFAVEVTAAGTGVLVTQGKVQISGFDELLVAGQQLFPDPDGSSIEPMPRATAALSWMRGLIEAAHSPLVPESEYSGGALVAVDPHGEQSRLSLRDYHIDVHIEDGFARTTIDQTYFNRSASRLEGTFYFPLPADASISRLAMYVGGKLMEGGMAERDRARNVFETIKHRSLDPALLEWIDGTTFKMRVFPIEGRQEKRIILSYTQKLDGDDGVTNYRFPAGHNLEIDRNWSLRVNVVKGAGLQWECSSHDLQPSTDDGNLLLTRSGTGVRGMRDVVIKLTQRAGSTATGELPVEFRAVRQDGQQYLMARCRPQLSAPARQPRHDWVFLLDADGSRDPLLARAQVDIVRTMLHNAGHDDTFSIVTAGTRVHAFAAEAKPVRAEPIETASEFLDTMHLVGALDLRQALVAARQFAEAVPAPILVHVGSGVPILGPRDINRLLDALPANIPYVGVGVGKQWNRAFMKRAAARSGGFATQINPDEPLAWRAMELLSTLNAPRLLGIQVAADDPQIKFLVWNDSVANGQELCAVTRYAGNQPALDSITIRGQLGADTWQRTVPVEKVEDGADYLPRFWAKLTIDDMVMRDARAHKDEIVALSKSMYVMSPFTSLLVLENDAMYDQYNIDRGRKDHWALYPCPERIDVSKESLDGTPAPSEKAGDSPAKPSPQEVLRTLVWHYQPEAMTRFGAADTRHNWKYSVPDGGTVLLGGVRRWSDGRARFGVPPQDARFVTDGLFTHEFLAYDPRPLRMMVTPRVIIENEDGEQLGERSRFDVDYAEDFEPIRLQARMAQADFDSLIDLIDTTIRPETWDETWDANGSWGTIQPFKTDLSLVISQTQSIQTESLLARVYPVADLVIPVQDADFSKFNGWMGGFGGEMTAMADVLTNPPDTTHWARASNGRTYFMFGDPIGDVVTADDKALAKLNEKRSFRYDNATLDEIIAEIRARFEMKIEVRSEALEQTEPPVGHKRLTLSINQTSLHSALRLILSKLNLTYYLDEGTIYITTQSDLREQLELRSRWLDDTLLLFPVRRGDTALTDSTDSSEERAAMSGSEMARLVNAWSRQMLDRDKEDQTGPLLLYPSLHALSNEQAFRKLTDFAPGLNTTLADALSVLESEADLGDRLRQGSIDEQARELVDRARTGGWRRVAYPGGTLTVDGQGRYYYDGRTRYGLRETAINDGKHIWHLYPELGLGARRDASRFHRAALTALTPWVLSPVEDLARGADVRVIGPQTVAIVPHQSEDAADDNERPLPRHFRTHLVFAENGQLAERRLVEMPSGKVLAKLTIGAAGHLRWFDGSERLIGERRLEVSPGEAPNLVPDLDSLVILPVPVRTPQHIFAAVAKARSQDINTPAHSNALRKIVDEQSRQDANDPVHWSDEDALRLLAVYLWQDPAELKDLIGRRFFARGDRRLGFYTLLLSSGEVWSLRQPISLTDNTAVRMNPVKDHPQSRLAWYIHRELESAQRRRQDVQRPDSLKENLFIEQLSDFRQLCAEWSSIRELTTNVEQRGQRLDELFDFIKSCDSPRSAYVLLRRLQRRLGHDQPYGRIAEAIIRLEERGWSSYVVKYELARSLAETGHKQQAVELLLDLYKSTLESGYVPRIDKFYVASLSNVDANPFHDELKLPENGFPGYMRAVAEHLIEQHERPTAIVLAWQCRQLGQADLAERLFRDALTGVPEDDVPTTLAAIVYLWAAKDYDRALETLDLLARQETLHESPALHWLCARIASEGGRLAQSIRFRETALDLEFHKMPERYNVEPVRARYATLFSQYQDLARLTTVSGETPPAELVSRIVQATDRWRSLETDVTGPCQHASRLLATLGLHDIAWDYLTTPLASKPNESTAWLDLAKTLREERRYDLASRAYKSAFEAEPTNAQILWDHARLLDQAGQTQEARQLYDQIARGQWQPRFQSLQRRAQRIMSEP